MIETSEDSGDQGYDMVTVKGWMKVEEKLLKFLTSRFSGEFL